MCPVLACEGGAHCYMRVNALRPTASGAPAAPRQHARFPEVHPGLTTFVGRCQGAERFLYLSGKSFVLVFSTS